MGKDPQPLRFVRLHSPKHHFRITQHHWGYLHDLVSFAAEVLGAEAGQEVPGCCRQECSQPSLEPIGNETDICQLRSAEVIDFHLSDGIENMELGLTVTEVLWKQWDVCQNRAQKKHIISSFRKWRCHLPCWNTLTEHPPELLQLSGRKVSTSLLCCPCRSPPCKSALWRGRQRAEMMQPWKECTDLCSLRIRTLCKNRHSGIRSMEDLLKSRHIQRCWSRIADSRQEAGTQVDFCKAQNMLSIFTTLKPHLCSQQAWHRYSHVDTFTQPRLCKAKKNKR